MDEVRIPTLALSTSCRKGGKEGGREETGVTEGIRTLMQPYR